MNQTHYHHHFSKYGVASLSPLSFEEALGSSPHQSHTKKRVIHPVQGREVVPMRRCACLMVYTGRVTFRG
ncbi:hypothetical protein ACOSQ4_001509 [Xanthoceras sorbifolium]